MAKSKLVEVNKKIEEKVVGSYKSIEAAAVNGYKKIEDKFVDQYLTKDDETIEEAKQRLKKEHAQKDQEHALRKVLHEHK